MDSLLLAYLSLDTLAQWREVPETNTAQTCRVKQRCLKLGTLHLGSYAFLLDGPGILGKAMQMAIFTRASALTEVVTAHIYLFNNISSDAVWTVCTCFKIALFALASLGLTRRPVNIHSKNIKNTTKTNQVQTI